MVIECLHSLEAPVIASVFMTYFFTFGFPEQLCTDSAGYFTARLTQEVFKIFKAHRIPTAPYSPFSQGLSERFIQTVKNKLKPILQEHGARWPSHIKAIQFAINTSPNATTDYEPARLFLGRCLRSIFDVQFPIDKIDMPKDQAEFYQQTLESLLIAQRLANQNIIESPAKRDVGKAQPISYDIGQHIWLLCNDPSSKTSYRITM